MIVNQSSPLPVENNKRTGIVLSSVLGDKTTLAETIDIVTKDDASKNLLDLPE